MIDLLKTATLFVNLQAQINLIYLRVVIIVIFRVIINS